MTDWIGAHQSELTLVLTVLLACFLFAVWASRKGPLQGPPPRGVAERPPGGPPPPSPKEFHDDSVRCGESDIPIDDVLDKHRREGTDGLWGQRK